MRIPRLPAVAALLLSAGVALAHPATARPATAFEPGPTANQYADALLHSVPVYAATHDLKSPRPAPGFTNHFTHKAKIIGQVKGQFDYTNCQVGGTTQLSREGNASVSGQPGTKRLTFALRYPGTFNCDGTLKYGKLPEDKFKLKCDRPSRAQVTIDGSSSKPSTAHTIPAGPAKCTFTDQSEFLRLFPKQLFIENAEETAAEAINKTFTNITGRALADAAARTPWPFG
ncbi:hypothetical protein OS965_32695 [Streptomyces sp. H27-G5]|uniref:hypothetical protein n=1 Tax=Streptomyces sp. H27-G5 TaxID=2996698 RepID=UPI00226F603D|nr:hypothetical protein [Streptomyces sp. H27-G5]MCY0922848.1 hypothetical protein [Streptomyces sp. H27-G5]